MVKNIPRSSTPGIGVATGGVSGEVRTEPGKDRAVATVPAVAYVGRQRIVHEGAYEMVRKAQPKSRAASVLS